MAAHGTRYHYDIGCRCRDCSDAKFAYARLQRAKRRAEGRPSYARELVATRERRRRYRGTCPTCGGEMSGGNGQGRDPERCLKCERARKAAQHGTRSKYQAGCRCGDCTRAATEAHREYMARRKAAA